MEHLAQYRRYEGMNTFTAGFGRTTQRTVVQLLLSVMLLWSVACQSAAVTTTTVNDAGGNRTLFSAEDATTDNVIYGDVTGNLTYWTPSETQIDLFEQKLADYFRAEGSDLAERLWTYNAQFAGYERNGNGEQVIYGNYYCRTFFEPEDHTRWVFVLDGGDCFFQAQYNLETESFDRVYVNGNA